MCDPMEDTSSYGQQRMSAEEEIAGLRQENESLKSNVHHYKTLADAFEKRYIDSQIECSKKNEEINRLRGMTGAYGNANGSVAGNSGYDSAEAEEVPRKLFVGGLSPQTTLESLTEHFQQFGEIVDSIVMKDLATGKSRCFGFIIYSDPSMVDAAQAARPHKIDGKVVDTKRAVPKGEPTDSPSSVGRVKRIFVGGLKPTTPASELREYFSTYGQIASLNTMEDKTTGKRKGFIYVIFEDYDSVDKACQQRYHTIDGRRVEVKRALDRSEMQHAGNMNSGMNPNMNFFSNLMANFAAGVPQGNYQVPQGNYQMPQANYQGMSPAERGQWYPGSAGARDQSAAMPMATGWGHDANAWQQSGYYTQQPAAGETKTGNKTGPIRSNKYMERSVGPYANNYGAYGGMQTQQ